MFSLKLFGGACLAGENGPLTGPAAQRHRLALLALLATSHPRALSRDKLMTCLWPERDVAHARQLLNQAVYALRRALGEEAILSTGEELRFNACVVQCDVIEFEEALAAGELERAVGLHAGPFLDGFFLSEAPEFEDWVDRERERLASGYVRALEALAGAAEGQGNFPPAVAWWKVRAAQDPYDSRVALRLMQALDASGNLAGALQHAAIHQRLLQEEFGVAPPPEVRALTEWLRREPTGRVEPEVGRRAETATGSPGPVLVEQPEARGVAAVPVPPAERLPRRGRKRRLWRGAGVLVLVVSMLSVLRWHQGSSIEEASAVAGSETQPQLVSLAVLPLKNYSGDSAQEYFADGMTEELITTLTKIEALRVIAHQSVLQFKHSQQPVPEIARLLEVKYVVAGSVLQDGERVRVTASLIDATTNTPVWGERFERERRDVLALQREVALTIARQIEITLTPQDRARLADAPQVDPEVFDLYVRGTQARWEVNPAKWREAARYFAQAIARDSAFAPAYAGVAFAEASIGLSSLGDKHLAKRFAEKALELDPSLAEAHVVLGVIRQFYDWDWVGAEDALRQAIRLNPGYAEAHQELSLLLMRLGRFEEALREAQHAVYLSPLSSAFQEGLGQVYLFSGRYDEAAGVAERLISAEPSSGQAYWLLGMAYVQQGRYAEAEEAFERASGLGRDCLRDLGYVYAVSGRRAEAREVLDALKERRRKGEEWWAGYHIAIVHAGLGEREQALDWLEQTVTPGAAVIYLGIHPWLHPLHGEPRFQALLSRMGLGG